MRRVKGGREAFYPRICSHCVAAKRLQNGGFDGAGMRIVHIAAGLEFGGVAEVAVMLALHQRLAGHAVRLVTVARAEDALIAGVERAAAAGVEIVRFAPSFPRPLFFSRRMVAGLGAVLKDADVVHVHSNWTFPVWWGCRTALKYGKRLVMTPHGCLSPERLADSGWKKRLPGVLDRHFLRRADVLHATCEEEARDIAGYCDHTVVAMARVKGEAALRSADEAQSERRDGGPGAGKAPAMARVKGGGGPAVVVVPNGVDVGEFHSGVPRDYWQRRLPELDGRRVVLALGRLHPVKGLDLLLEAWGLLLRPHSLLRKCYGARGGRNGEGKKGRGAGEAPAMRRVKGEREAFTLVFAATAWLQKGCKKEAGRRER